MTLALIVMAAAGTLLAGALLKFRATHMRDTIVSPTESSAADPLIEQINALLPQTQCRRCTFEGCRPYASALARGEADINQCPPGGDNTARALARLLGRQTKPVDPRFGLVRAVPLVAWIDEPACIGCTKCIQACPVDAIVGASKFMHTVITAQCTGCELCVAPCPVDCIEMRLPGVSSDRIVPLARQRVS
jgi:Na+-translocating ferredoxin:NAD+ oxidoreductase subunit B